MNDSIASASNAFNKIVKLNDHDIQRMMRELDSTVLAKALKGSSDVVCFRFFSNMSQRAAVMLKQDIEFLDSIPEIEIVEAQQYILSIIKNLVQRDEIVFDIKDLSGNPPKLMELFENYLMNRQIRSEEPYSPFNEELMLCSFFGSKDGENILSEIERKNKEQDMGNIQIPNTQIKLINYSICPKCKKIFTYKDLSEYYSKPKPDTRFKNKAEQYRRDTRVFCLDCGSYFLPALILSDGTPRNEVQFLCKVQTAHAIEAFFMQKNKRVLTKNPNNILRKAVGKTIKNDVLLEDMQTKPALIINLLQYTPTNLMLNLFDGSNIEKGDLLYGGWYGILTRRMI